MRNVVTNTRNRWTLFFSFAIILLFVTVSYCQYLIPVGSFPRALVYNSTNSKVYCANSGDNTVSVINVSNNQVIATIRVGNYPCAFAYNSTSNKVYCVNQQSNDISIINGATDEVINTISVGLRSSALLFNPSNNTVYCANSSSNSVSVIDGLNDNVIATINVGGFPTCLTYNSTNNKIYSANTDGNSVTIIDCATNQAISTVPVGISPNSLAYNPINNEVYCSSWANGRIHMISGATNQLVDSIIYGNAGPQSLIYTYSNKVCYVNFTGDNIKLIDGASDTVIATYQFPVGTRPYVLSYNYPFIYCANIGNNSICVFEYYLYFWLYENLDNISYPIALAATSYTGAPPEYIANLWYSTVTRIRIIAIEEQSLSDIKPMPLTIYPNPAKSYFTVHSSDITNRSTLKIFDISGKLIKEKKLSKPDMNISLQGIKPGIYFLEFGTTTKKLIVTK